MNCQDARPQLRDLAADRLEPAARDELRAHLRGCPECSRAEAGERALDDLLEQRLPRQRAPAALRERLERLAETRPGRTGAGPGRWTRFLAPALAAGLALALVGVLVERSSSRREGDLASLAAEAIDDHLRVLAAQRPLEIESGGVHQVKPWFEGKLDFAPAVPALEGDELQLRGGSVGYLFDRKAAVLVYGLRRHVVTLLVFRAQGLEALDGGGRQLGPVRAQQTTARGFNAVLWRAGDLGYALVSDVNAGELAQLAASLAAAAAR